MLHLIGILANLCCVVICDFLLHLPDPGHILITLADSINDLSMPCHEQRAGAGLVAATDSTQLLDSRVHSSLLVAYSRVRHSWVGRALEYATPG